MEIREECWEDYLFTTCEEPTKFENVFAEIVDLECYTVAKLYKIANKHNLHLQKVTEEYKSLIDKLPDEIGYILELLDRLGGKENE